MVMRQAITNGPQDANQRWVIQTPGVLAILVCHAYADWASSNSNSSASLDVLGADAPNGSPTVLQTNPSPIISAGNPSTVIWGIGQTARGLQQLTVDSWFDTETVIRIPLAHHPVMSPTAIRFGFRSPGSADNLTFATVNWIEWR